MLEEYLYKEIVLRNRIQDNIVFFPTEYKAILDYIEELTGFVY